MDSRDNHIQVGAAIALANEGLAKDTELNWSLSRDLCYQMSNRFAQAWKLTSLGKPVILIYLGFIGCEEMRDRSKTAPLWIE